MTKETQLACEEYEQMLLAGTKYSGNQKKELRIFSASMLGNEPLQNYLKFKHGGNDSTQFEANTLGSIYQLGVDAIFDKDLKSKLRYSSGLRIKIELSNGWTVSGEMDQIDWEKSIIFDNKVTTSTTITKIKSEGLNHGYALQMGVYKWLLKEFAISREEEVAEFTSVLPVVDKGFSYFKPSKFNQLTFVQVDTHSHEDIGTLLLDATNELDKYIELDQAPGKCLNVWPYGRKGVATKPMRCRYYCDFSKHCDHYSSEYQDVNKLLGL